MTLMNTNEENNILRYLFNLRALASLRNHVVILLFLFLPFFIFAQDSFNRDFVKALSSNDFIKVENMISGSAKQLSYSDKRLVYIFVLDYAHKENILAILELLQSNEIVPSLYDLFNAINRNHSDEVIQFILDKGVKPNGEILLFAAEKDRFNLVYQFAELGADVNYQYPAGSAYANGMTALLYAIKKGDFETVKILVEQGAEVNIADNQGYTPASLSKELGFIEMNLYLIEHGADDVETIVLAEEVVQADDEHTNNTAENVEQGIASLMDTKQITLKAGTYRLAGSSMQGNPEIVIPNSAMGAFSYYSQGVPLMGGFRIDKGTIIIMMQGKNHTYNIDSETSFSGYGERWVRKGE
jgi:hypothetical protein